MGLKLFIAEMKECETNAFIDFWKTAYDGEKFDWKDYLKFMDFRTKLTEEYVLRACQWKKGREWKEGVRPENFGKYWSAYIRRWMDKATLDYLENVRKNGENIHTFFNKLTDLGTFQTIRMQSFIAHTVRPFDFPILDVNVWRSYIFLRNGSLNNKNAYKIDDYIAYKTFFDILTKEYEKNFDINNAQYKNKLRKRKDIDDALMTFGQFLNNYWNLVQWRGKYSE